MDEARLFDAAWIARETGGKLEGHPGRAVLRVVSDSRAVVEGSLFVALRGERVDGHAFAGDAARSGASVLLVEERSIPAVRAALAFVPEAPSVVVVPDALAALQRAATAWRARFPGVRRVGITGSSGKTTTKECLAEILSVSRSVARNEGNFNSEIGLPLSMFRITGREEFGVFEMGINHPGEMDVLASVLDPDLALVTNIGTAHIGMFGSREAIAAEKKRIFSRFDGSQTAFVREDEPFRAFLSEGVRGSVVAWGPRSLEGFEGATDRGLDGWTLRWRGKDAEFLLPGVHNLSNALAACAVAERAGASDDVAEGLSAVRPLFGRGEIARGRITVVRDCYNANPESTESAIDFCDSVPWSGRKAYVIGSMLELGAESAPAHARVGAAAARSRAGALFFFGEEARAAFDAAAATGTTARLAHHDGFDGLERDVLDWLREGDLVLLKASRGMALERLAESIGAKAR